MIDSTRSFFCKESHLICSSLLHVFTISFNVHMLFSQHTSHPANIQVQHGSFGERHRISRSGKLQFSLACFYHLFYPDIRVSHKIFSSQGSDLVYCLVHVTTNVSSTSCTHAGSQQELARWVFAGKWLGCWFLISFCHLFSIAGCLDKLVIPWWCGGRESICHVTIRWP